MKPFLRHLRTALICLAFGFAASSFWGGFSCDTTIKTMGDRIQLGLIWIALSVAKLGRITTNPLRTNVYNAWPLALIVGFVLFALVYSFQRYKKRNHANPGA